MEHTNVAYLCTNASHCAYDPVNFFVILYEFCWKLNSLSSGNFFNRLRFDKAIAIVRQQISRMQLYLGHCVVSLVVRVVYSVGW